LELARTADPHLRGAGQRDRLRILAAEHDNLLAALRWAVETPDVPTGLELLASASTYLWIRGASASVAPYAIALLDAVGDAPSEGSRLGLGEEYAICVLLAASGGAGRPVWRRHRAAAEKALAASWPGDRAGRYPAALLLWLRRNASEHDPGGAFAHVSSQRD
ncbi:AfsR/SARP family transcriptional regulator, partial [Streptomyces sp. MCAF7]